MQMVISVYTVSGQGRIYLSFTRLSGGSRQFYFETADNFFCNVFW